MATESHGGKPNSAFASTGYIKIAVEPQGLSFQRLPVGKFKSDSYRMKHCPISPSPKMGIGFGIFGDRQQVLPVSFLHLIQ
jgi:hypothetical protein